MASRNQLKGVARGTVEAFVSRNNDWDGYWAIGKLCRRALSSNGIVEADVLPLDPSGPLADMMAICGSRLRKHVRRAGLDESVVRSAVIRVEFDPKRDRSVSIGPSAANVHYSCVVRVLDDRGKWYDASASGSGTRTETAPASARSCRGWGWASARTIRRGAQAELHPASGGTQMRHPSKAVPLRSGA